MSNSPIHRETVARLVADFVSKNPAPNAPAPAAKPASPPAATPPALRLTDFVSESDVRTAVTRGEKIAIGPKTIVTPAARDLATEHDILVMHHPSPK